MGDHLATFFQQYPDFRYNASKPVMSEFSRMCDFFSWKEEDPKRTEAQEGIDDAINFQFNDIYGTDVDDIRAWEGLCRASDTQIPHGIEACRKVSN